MRPSVVLLLVAVGCASAGKPKPCQHLVAVAGMSDPVYAECALDARPRVTNYPRPDLARLSLSGMANCFVAHYDLVIDPTGKAIAQTAALVRTNNQRYADELRSVLSELRYTPATKNGQAVMALVRFEGSLMTRPPGGRPPPC